jgi:hypothetical protein
MTGKLFTVVCCACGGGGGGASTSSVGIGTPLLNDGYSPSTKQSVITRDARAGRERVSYLDHLG